MIANCGRYLSKSRQRGFTFLELVVVITIISALAVVALNRYYKLLVDVERTSMEHDLGAMRSAISLQFAGYYVTGNMAGLKDLVDSNPMDLLAEKPNNYLGVISHYKIEDIEKGSWFYDSKEQTLIYLVRNQLYFETKLADPARARFKIYPVYSDRVAGRETTKYISGLTLKEEEPYRWLRPWG
ncbi:MAG: type II secretion system GspH family protein [Deltaproteobacteria bacterium]|nr:type II secretion system GspH family protein [Deltaproteobacteria bacterium]MCW8893769.1 type II secretion system GspH family protein [Deltaproteobacteria bacterium]MCW9050589.1 type II secretion system GspH family protein [Deltaproteobacteria bacterium]